MASTNKTTNYELSQFEGTDKPSWEADYNADMLAIDTNLKAVSDVADGASGNISTLSDRMTAAEGNITTNANDIDALEARADALEAGQTSDDSRLDALEAEQIVQNTAIESNTRLGYNLARPYDSASTYNVGAYVLFQDTLYKCTTAIATGEAFDPTKWLAIKATDEIAAGGYTLPVASASTLGGVKVGDGLSIDNNDSLSTTMNYMDINTTSAVNLTNFTYSINGASEAITSSLNTFRLTRFKITNNFYIVLLSMGVNISSASTISGVKNGAMNFNATLTLNSNNQYYNDIKDSLSTIYGKLDPWQTWGTINGLGTTVTFNANTDTITLSDLGLCTSSGGNINTYYVTAPFIVRKI